MRAFLLAMFVALAQPAFAQATLTVTGEGAVTATPDMATLTLGVSERAARADAAMNAVSDRVETIVQRLGAAGIAPADMQTATLSLNPVRENGPQAQAQFVGFEASNQLRVTVRDLDRLGDVMQSVLDEGANRMASLRFGLQEPRPVEDEARRAAVADARAKAELYAEAAGVRLGAIESISEAGNGGGGPQPMFAMEAARSVPVEAGSTTVTARVTIVWALAQ